LRKNMGLGMVQLRTPALHEEWSRLVAANWRFGPVEAVMRARALVEISQGVSTVDLLKLAAERSVPKAASEEKSFRNSDVVERLDFSRPRRPRRQA
jgi:hypothetical protein